MRRLMNISLELADLVFDVALAIKRVDERRPQAVSSRTGVAYQAGIGPHPETQAVSLIVSELQADKPERYNGRLAINVPYVNSTRQRCDLCFGSASEWEWAAEIKMLRLMGDNGKPNDNMLMHILSPYPADRSALTDCRKLLSSGLGVRKAILIYGFDYATLSMDLAIDAFETLATKLVRLGPRLVGEYSGLVHPVHSCGRVFGWEIRELSD
jgi:hypothetical protein